VPERRRIFGESTVLENLKIGAYLAGPPGRRDPGLRLSHVPGPEKTEKQSRRFLSGGEQQMLAIGGR